MTKYLQVYKYLCGRGSFQGRSPSFDNRAVPTHLYFPHVILQGTCLASSLLSDRDSKHATFRSTEPHGIFTSNLKPEDEKERRKLTSVLRKLMTEFSAAAAVWGWSSFTSAFSGCSAVRLLTPAESCRMSLLLQSSIS